LSQTPADEQFVGVLPRRLVKLAPMDQRDLTARVKQLARQAGFARVGVASAQRLDGEARYRRWLEQGRHGAMAYLERNIPMRFDPRCLVEGAGSVIVLAASYAAPPPRQQVAQAGASPAAGLPAPALGSISLYARGRDYHRVLKKRCHGLMDRLRELEPGFEGRAFVDSAPLSERSVAAAAGLGWIGRNGCLVVPRLGSWVFLAEIVCNLPLVPGSPIQPQCGDCRACIEACPAPALPGDGTLDARRCVSALTIEHRGPIEEDCRPALGNRIFGCDICQKVCPHNAPAAAGDPALSAATCSPTVELRTVLAWTSDDWDAFTRGSARRRGNLQTWLRNAVIAAGNSGDASLAGALRELSGRQPALAQEIDWALGRLET
jgi:epoxyqueuosine reductase